MSATLIARSNLTQLRAIFTLMRPKQWIKNSFVLAPLVFTGKFLEPTAINQTLLATFLFCLASSATYIVNDIHDIEQDKQHPKKSRTRPLALGLVSIPMALVLLVVLYAALLWGAFIEPKVMLVIAAYIALNIAYTFALKNQPVIDIFTLAIGFVLRVYAGAISLNVPVSIWMLVTTLSLSLYLAAIKRRQEFNTNGSAGRRVLEKYSISLIDKYTQMSATCAIVFYSMFVMSTRPQLVFTVPLVLFGLFRYWYVVEQLDSGESPTDALMSDWQLLMTVMVWLGACVWSLWPRVY